MTKVESRGANVFESVEVALAVAPNRLHRIVPVIDTGFRLLIAFDSCVPRSEVSRLTGKYSLFYGNELDRPVEAEPRKCSIVELIFQNAEKIVG